MVTFMSPDWPATLTEAVDRLMSTMTADDLAALRDTLVTFPPKSVQVWDHMGSNRDSAFT